MKKPLKFCIYFLITANKVLSGHSGLILFDELWNRLNLNNRIRRFLPKKKKNRGTKQVDKFKSILFSFASGNDCLSDLDERKLVVSPV
jgi:hypothetical protein